VLVGTLLDRRLRGDSALAVSDVRDSTRRLRVTAGRRPPRGREAGLVHAARVLRATVRALDSVLRLGEPPVTLGDGMAEILVAHGRGDLASVAVQVTGAVGALDADVHIDPDIVRGLLLAAEIATAESPDEVRAALDSVVAPVGAWRMKRERPMVSVGGLVGAAGGLEWAVGSGLSDPDSVAAGALLGSLGIDVSFPVDASTLGFYVSVLDVGGLMSLPFGTLRATVRTPAGEARAELDVEPRISAVQVISPGLYLRWGLPGMPLVLGVGGSVVPLARHVRTAAGSADPFEADVSILRLSAFLAVDVTLLPL